MARSLIPTSWANFLRGMNRRSCTCPECFVKAEHCHCLAHTLCEFLADKFRKNAVAPYEELSDFKRRSFRGPYLLTPLDK
jgi:hypothetical protein